MENISLLYHKAKNKNVIYLKVFGALSVVILLYNLNLVCNLMCYLVPVFSALDNLLQKKKHNIAMILLVFILLSLLECIENVAGELLIKILPYYFIIKIISIGFLIFPDLKGLNLIYSNMLLYLLANNDVKYSCKYKLREYFDEQERRFASVSLANNDLASKDEDE
jgi:hypothetical protein